MGGWFSCALRRMLTPFLHLACEVGIIYVGLNLSPNRFWGLISLVVQRLKSFPAMRETWVLSLGREDPLEKEMATHSSKLAHGRRSLVGYSPWGPKELDTTERILSLVVVTALHQCSQYLTLSATGFMALIHCEAVVV